MLNDKQKRGLDPLIKAAVRQKAGLGGDTINYIEPAQSATEFAVIGGEA